MLQREPSSKKIHEVAGSPPWNKVSQIVLVHKLLLLKKLVIKQSFFVIYRIEEMDGKTWEGMWTGKNLNVRAADFEFFFILVI